MSVELNLSNSYFQQTENTLSFNSFHVILSSGNIVMIKHLLNIILLTNFTLAQDAVQNNKNYEKNAFREESEQYSRSNLINNIKSIDIKNVERDRYFKKEIFEKSFYKVYREEKNSIDLISSVGNNMNFGGIWEKYAVINFTPQIYIQPAGFISIYANHYVNCLIPLNAVKDYSKSILVQGIAVVAVENSMKLFLSSNDNWITEVISFGVKNLLLSILIKPFVSSTSNSPSPVLQYDNYYYSMNITF